MLLGFETFSYLPRFLAGRMDVFGFIRRARELGLDGVPLGRGSIDLPACYRILAERTPLRRICIEVCYGYRAVFRMPETQGAGGRLGSGAFRVALPPHDPACLAPYPNHQNPALIAYSEFNIPGPDGTPRKSIRVRRVKASAH